MYTYISLDIVELLDLCTPHQSPTYQLWLKFGVAVPP
jgi:hypothetical protein